MTPARAPLLDALTCAIDDCDGSRYCRGWCSKHYFRWFRHGDPMLGGRDERARLTYAEKVERWKSQDPNRWRPSAHGRAVCDVCGRWAALTADGRMKWHGPRLGLGPRGSAECAGTGRESMGRLVRERGAA